MVVAWLGRVWCKKLFNCPIIRYRALVPQLYSIVEYFHLDLCTSIVFMYYGIGSYSLPTAKVR